MSDARIHPRAVTPPPLPARCRRCDTPVALHWGRSWQWVDVETHRPHRCEEPAA